MGYIQYGVKWLSLLNKVIHHRAQQQGTISFKKRLCFTKLFDNMSSVTLDAGWKIEEGVSPPSPDDLPALQSVQIAVGAKQISQSNTYQGSWTWPLTSRLLPRLRVGGAITFFPLMPLWHGTASSNVTLFYVVKQLCESRWMLNCWCIK